VRANFHYGYIVAHISYWLFSAAVLLCTPRARPTHKRSKMPADDDAPKMEGGKDASLSIQETNKLRAKLGLRALDVGEKV